MAYKKRTYRKKRPIYRRKAGPVKRSIRKAKKGMFAKKVKRVVNKMSETKVVNNASVSRPIYNVLNSSQFQGSIIPLGPGSASPALFTISQGTGQGNRVGNKIQTVKMMLRGNVRLNTYFNNTTNYNPIPGYVTMWIVKLKPFLNDDVTTLKAVIDGSFFQSGSGGVGMSGQTSDLYRQVNSQQIQLIKRRVWKVGTSSFPGGGASGTGDQSNQYWNNNDFSLTRIFKQDITKAVPKVMAFNDANDNYVNRHSYLFFTFIRMDGAIPQTSLGAYSGVIPAYVDMEVDYMFKDV